MISIIDIPVSCLQPRVISGQYILSIHSVFLRSQHRLCLVMVGMMWRKPKELTSEATFLLWVYRVPNGCQRCPEP